LVEAGRRGYIPATAGRRAPAGCPPGAAAWPASASAWPWPWRGRKCARGLNSVGSVAVVGL